jgi:hypothetical protein
MKLARSRVPKSKESVRVRSSSLLFERFADLLLTELGDELFQIVRPLESIADTQPQLKPALLRLSAMVSQYFTRG